MWLTTGGFCTSGRRRAGSVDGQVNIIAHQFGEMVQAARISANKRHTVSGCLNHAVQLA